MFASVSSFTLAGIDALPVEVEVHLAKGMPRMFVVGLPDAAVKEARRRVEAAITNSEYPNPHKTMIVNLAPAPLRKEGSLLDLPIALGVLAAAGWLGRGALRENAVAGELALDGQVRGVRGALAMALEAKRLGKSGIILPRQNAHEAALCDGITVVGVGDLREALDYLEGRITPPPTQRSRWEGRHTTVCLSDVRGQAHAKRALEVAAAGGHNLLMVGPPGSGKTMLAQRICGILPDLTFEEALEVTRIQSIAGALSTEGSLVSERPFRMPHHSISQAGLIGGGSPLPRPGEITLAHHGVLFLDEFPEFRRDALEALRQPLESGFVSVSRSMASMRFPASTVLVGSMNPCPCGYWGDTERPCNCSAGRLHKYREKLSGPLLDRFDMLVEVPRLKPDEITGTGAAEDSGAVRGRVAEARALQAERGSSCNARMLPADVSAYCRLDPDMKAFISKAIKGMNLSARGYDRCLRIARSIADLDGRGELCLADLAEAVQYRAPIATFADL